MFFPPDEVRQIMHSEQQADGYHGPDPARFHVKFDAKIEGPIETIPYQPKYTPPHWEHRPAVIAAIVFIIAIVTTIILVLTLVTPTLHSPDH